MRSLLAISFTLSLVALLAAPPAVATSTAATAQIAAQTDAQIGAGVVAQAPVPGPVVRGFDPPPTPYAAGHRGVDVSAAPGDPVRAALPGTVTFAGPVARTRWISVDHGHGLITTYGPVDPPAVHPGRVIEAGTVLGWLAEDATHLDWGARLDGVYIDPSSLLRPWLAYLVAW